jgi:hypothetical protein
VAFFLLDTAKRLFRPRRRDKAENVQEREKEPQRDAAARRAKKKRRQ